MKAEAEAKAEAVGGRQKAPFCPGLVATSGPAAAGERDGDTAGRFGRRGADRGGSFACSAFLRSAVRFSRLFSFACHA